MLVDSKHRNLKKSSVIRLFQPFRNQLFRDDSDSMTMAFLLASFFARQAGKDTTSSTLDSLQLD